MPPTRHQIVATLDEISRLLELEESNRFRASAYKKAARSLEQFEGDLFAVAEKGALLSIPAIGKGIAPIIEELIRNGSTSYLDELRSKYPREIFQLLRVANLGLRKVLQLRDELGVETIEDLRTACAQHKLRMLRGFGAKTEESVCKSLEEVGEPASEWLLPKGLAAAVTLSGIVGSIKGVEAVEVSGTLRRRLEIFSEIVLIVVTSSAARVAKEIAAIDLLAGASVETGLVRARFRDFPVAFYLVDAERLGNALLITTGSDAFVEALTQTAANRQVVMRRDFADEDDLFEALGSKPVPPELREDASLVGKKRLPKLITREALRGAFHIHSTWSDGRDSIESMLDAAVQQRLQYAGLSDHSKSAGYAGGLTETRLSMQQKEIEKLRGNYPSLRIFKGSEVDILIDGSLDYEPKTLASFDFVVASIHSRFKMSREEMTARMIRAIENPFTTFLGHLTGRKLLTRPGYELDYDQIFDAAAAHGVIIEINGNPNRLDVDWRLMKRAIDRGVIFSIHPDAHSTGEFDALTTGVWNARKGAMEPRHIFNTLPVDEVAAFLAQRRAQAIKASSK